jgi:hypothetical protein
VTVQTVRPDSTSLSTGVTGVGGAVTNHGALSDVSDTTGITATVDNGYTVLGLANPTALASNQRVKQWRIRMRVARTTADQHVQRVEVKLRDAANRLSAADTISYGSTAVAEFAGPWRANGPGNIAFTNTILNAMRMDVVWRPRINGANEWLEARGAFVDFDYNTQPVVSGVSLSGVTTTSFPDVNWSYTDTEGDPQVRFRVKVFETAIATAGGFDPETAQTAYDSGEMTGNATNITVTKSLLNGTAYTPYVKAAQAWPGPEGAYWWSAWVGGSSATIALSPPAAVTRTTTIINSLPDYRALHVIVPGSPGGGTSNDIQLQVLEKTARVRGNFYNWAHAQIASCGAITYGTDGFYPRSGTIKSLPLDTAFPGDAQSDVGTRMISWTPSAANGLDIGWPNTNPLTDETPPYVWPAINNVQMRVSLWARIRGAGSFTTKLHHISVDYANVTQVGGDQSGSAVALTNSWQRLEFSTNPVSGAVYGRIFFENFGANTGVEVNITGIQVGPDPGANAMLQSGIGRWMPFPPDSPWVDVRTREVLTGYASGASVYIVDNELYPGRPLIYRARAVTTVSGQQVVGQWTYFSMYCPTIGTTMIRDPYQPDNVLLAKRDGRSDETNVTDEAVFHASGRDGDPITLSDWVGGQDGSMILSWESIQEEKNIRDLVKSTRPILVQWHNGGASYVQFGSRSWKHWDANGGQFTGDYIEKDRP